ncbi:hypothetical protein G7Y89_g3856 [Cudoniella acicularis]|uniref:Cytochrome c oxidase assembly factor 6 n=1 Tax=Cudoniella acicularis TaxID=354080 RepID=A0A8H4RSG7_9HELO|nr:hypothetical protein G7Y89_g3856 [Cudoniella acicularis]
MPHAILPNTTQKHGDWRDDLFTHGYAIIKNAVPEDRAAGYLESMTQWLEKFPLGFDRNDPGTWTPEHLPAHMKGGMYHGYAVSHEKFIWDARLEPGLLNAFAKIWQTEKLLVSFNSINLTLPSLTSTSTSAPALVPRWPHQDQSPHISGFQCAQGILNLAPNGPQDGRLIRLEGSHLLNDEFFKTHSKEKKEAWGKMPDDWHGFDDDEVACFEERGCEVVKVCCGPGDLVVWDSRVVHWNVRPEGRQIRSVVYACYIPAALASPEELAKKKEIFEKREHALATPEFLAANRDLAREREIEYEFRARDKEEDGNNTVSYKLSATMLLEILQNGEDERGTNPIKLFNIHTNPNIHPTVVSPLKLRQLNTKSKLKCLPATSAENKMSMVATPYQMPCMEGLENWSLQPQPPPSPLQNARLSTKMGLFSSSSPATLPPPKISVDGAPIAPDRSQRARCWEARDAYFHCLDKNNIIDSITEKDKAEKGCASEGRGFEANCASSWVTYFKKRRVMEYQKNQTLDKLRKEGAQQMPGEIGAGAPGQKP